MIQDIHPHLFSNKFIVTTGIFENDYIFYFEGNSLLLKQISDGFEIPKKKDFREYKPEGIFLFTLNNINCFLVWEYPTGENIQFSYHEIRYLYTTVSKEIDWACSVAFQLKNWYLGNKFCGKCGTPTVLDTNERAINCPSCQTKLYPNISPAIIVAILSNDKILLARGVNFRDGLFSLVAGYVDIGESIENTVIREVKEEVGLDVKDIQYYNSQPWPFSGSMMIGFIAKGNDSQPIQIDENEIVDAAWYSRKNLPTYPPDRSIAGEIIDKFKNGEL